MRVDYTLPSIQPENLPELPGSVETGISFRDQLRGPSTDITVGWQQQFHLDQRPPDATYLDPLPRPSTMDVRDPETQRTRWRSMLTRHDKMLASDSSLDSSDRHAVRVMLDMLLDMQQTEDSIVSQNAAVTRG
jgi:hypothetical protein